MSGALDTASLRSAPLSPAQRRLWFLQALGPASAAYNFSLVFRIEGGLRLASLEAALRGLCARHEILRTFFAHDGSEPSQHVLAQWAPAIDVIDVSHDAEPSAAGMHRAAERTRRAFSLDEPPFDVALFKLSASAYVLAIVVHHIVIDGWSRRLFLDELAALYDADVRDAQAVLSPVRRQYCDFAIAEQSEDRARIHANNLAYWKTQLQGATLSVTMPRDADALSSARTAAHVEHALPRDLVSRVRRSCRDLRITPFTLYAAAFHVLLKKLTGNEDCVFVTFAGHRPCRDFEQTLGFFVNTLPIRIGGVSSDTFRSLMRAASTTVYGALEHASLPLDSLLATLNGTGAGPAVTFNVAFSYLGGMGGGGFGLTGTTVTEIGVASPECKFEVAGVVTELGDDAGFLVEYAAEVYDQRTVERWAQWYEGVLRAIAEQPDLTVAALQLDAGPLEQHRMRRPAPTPREPAAWLVSMVERHAAATPERPAVRYGERTLGYKEFNERGNGVAACLARRGAGPESVVALLMDRCEKLPVALLGVMKTGAAFLPLDPADGPERLRHMVSAADAAVVLAASGHAARAESLFGGRVICIDACDERMPDRGAPAFHHGNLAYVMYTSGSTGTPKGVMVSYAALNNRIAWGVRTMGIRSEDCLLQKTPLTFDVALPEFFSAWAAGATLAVMEPEAHRSAVAIAEAISRYGVTVAHFIPSMLDDVLDHVDFDLLGSLRIVLCSGEALSLASAVACAERLHVDVWNLYGPTETAIEVSAWLLTPGARAMSLGDPISDVELLVLDEQMRRVPDGIAGELYVGGVSLARGYLNSPSLTAKRFVPHPFSALGERLYRTGDIVRYRHNGTLAFIGRTDSQIKLRGYRIDLCEIEHVLKSHPYVRSAAVRLVHQDGVRIGAFVVPKTVISVDDLLRHCRKHLPGHMLPAAIALMESMPMKPSGKVDYDALPQRRLTLGGLDGRYEAPANDDEALVANIFAEVLGLTNVSRNTDFFQLGGHSLLAARVTTMLRRSARGAPTLEQFFKAPTVAGVAARIRS